MPSKKKARPELERHQGRLREWERVPGRARRFHRARAELASRISKLLAGFFVVWINDNELIALDDQLRRLERVAEILEELCREAEHLEEEVNGLERRAVALDDLELVAWYRSHCSEWLVRLQRIAVDSDREGELFHERNEVNRIRDEVRLHHLVIHGLQQVDEVRTALAADPHAVAELLAEAAGFREDLLAGKVSAARLEQLKGVIKPLHELAERLKDPPRQLQSVGQLLPDLRGWAQLLQLAGSEVAELDNRHRSVVIEWTRLEDRQVDELLAEAEALSERLREHGRQQRRERLQAIEQQLHHLVEACGAQSGLEKRIAPLREMNVQRYQEHAAWLRRHNEANEFFGAIAKTRELELEERLKKVTDGLGTRLAELQRQPLSDAVLNAVQQLDIELGKLARLDGAIELLTGLGQVKELDGQLATLEQQAKEEMQRFTAQQADLRRFNQVLQEQAVQIELELDDLSIGINSLSAQVARLELARQAAEELAGKLADQGRLLINRCRQRIEAQQQRASAAVTVLKRLGLTPPQLVTTEVDQDTEPESAVAAVLEGTRQLDALERQTEHALAIFDHKRQEAVAAIKGVLGGWLNPGDRADAEQLLSELQESWTDADDTLDRLSRLDQLLERYRLFLHQVQQEQISATARLEALRRRLRSFNEAHLRRYCPELSDRVTALVFGTPHDPVDWQAVTRQVELAEQLLGRLELQARRLAVRELEQSAQMLARLVRSRPEHEPVVAPAREILAELAEHDPHELPPASLRMRVRSIAPKQQEDRA